jgi:hypothetical protein
MSRNLILINSSHYKGANKYEYKLPQPSDFTGYRLQLRPRFQCTIPHLIFHKP